MRVRPKDPVGEGIDRMTKSTNEMLEKILKRQAELHAND